jgi:hypothetical protein
MSGSPYMSFLHDALMSQRKLVASSATLYINSLYTLNGKKFFTNLAFLKNLDVVESRLEPYAPTTRANMITAAVAALSTVKEKASYKKTYTHYYSKMMDGSAALKTEAAKNQKTEKQEAAWMTWDEVTKRLAELKTAVAGFSEKTAITRDEYDTLINYVVLSFYVDIPPRRNADFLHMFVVRSHSEEMPKDRNYYDVSHQRMIFNVYKTAKSMGTQVAEIPESLQAALRVYLKFHPGTRVTKTGKPYEFPLLVDSFGDHYTALNSITRILGRIFGKRIGSSMLRHFYVSSKYGDVLTEMKEDSTAMAHGLSTQRAYIKPEDVPPTF